MGWVGGSGKRSAVPPLAFGVRRSAVQAIPAGGDTLVAMVTLEEDDGGLVNLAGSELLLPSAGLLIAELGVRWEASAQVKPQYELIAFQSALAIDPRQVGYGHDAAGFFTRPFMQSLTFVYRAPAGFSLALYVHHDNDAAAAVNIDRAWIRGAFWPD